MTLEGYSTPPPRPTLTDEELRLPALTDEELRDLMSKYNVKILERIAAMGLSRRQNE